LLGIDYYHPALGGGFGKGYKVIAGYDLVGNHWNSSDPNSLLEPDDDPLDDCGKKSSATGKTNSCLHISLLFKHFYFCRTRNPCFWYYSRI
jgi:hypothetical protein